MERDVYRSMRTLQRSHWWFLGRRRIVDALIGSLGLPPDAAILEAGAGSGGNIALLQHHGRVSAFEMDEEAAGFCNEDTNAGCVAGRLPDANPFADTARFDLVVALDVLEHIDEDVASLRSLASTLKPGGRMLLTVPAYPWLFSGHDTIHHHRRRYTRTTLERAATDAGLGVHRCGYFNSLLLPVAVAVRMGSMVFRRAPTSDASLPSRPLNALLAGVFGAEAGFVRRHAFPAGLSLFLLAGRD